MKKEYIVGIVIAVLVVLILLPRFTAITNTTSSETPTPSISQREEKLKVEDLSLIHI